MNYATVCSGIEAPSVAWDSLGFVPQWFSEIDKFPSAVLAHHYPHVPNLGDMTKLYTNPVFQNATIDILCGGTPCQSFSVAGLRKGLSDERGNLALEFIKLAAYKRPCWVDWENVPGVLSSNSGQDFASFLAGLTGRIITVPEGGWQNSGIIEGIPNAYGIAYRVLDAQYFGVAQRRRRVFVIGYLGDWRPAAAVLFERYSLSGYSAPVREAKQDLAGTITSSAARRRGSGIDPGDLVSALTTSPQADNVGQESKLIPVAMCMATGQGGAEIGDEISPTLNCNHEAPIAFTYGIDEECNVSDNHFGPLLRGGQGGTKQAVAYNSVTVYPINQITSPTNRSNPEPELCHTLSKSDCTPLGVFSAGAGAKVGGIAYSETVSPTLKAADCGNNRSPTIHMGMAVRRLTPLECERLQGFPDGYTKIPSWNGWRKLDPEETPELCIAAGMKVKQTKKTGVWWVNDPDGPRYKALGNSMAVPVKRWLGERMVLVQRIIEAIVKGGVS